MARPLRRAFFAPRLEVLESRTLLSVDPGNTLMLGFVPGVSTRAMSSILGLLRAQVLESFPGGPVMVQPGSGVNLDVVLPQIERSPVVRYAEPNRLIRLDAVVPNDPKFGQQWALNNPNNVDIDAPQAWQVTTGSASTIVAIIDSGIDTTNPELAGRLWTNPNEVAGNGRDDDQDGFVDDVHGWNFVNNNANINDGLGHGTHVAGILGAASNNAYGVAGVNWNARLMILKFIGSDGSGSVDNAVQAIYYAVQHGARVINASWGGPDYSQALDDAIRYAGNQGVVFVTAAGNESANNDITPSYPALDRLPNQISVAAIDASGNLASFSNYGVKTVDIAAPGVDILSTVPHGYASYSGTSMATPFVAGVVSLVVGLHPNWSATQLVQQVLATAKPLPSLTGLTVTGGIVDAASAVGGAVSSPPPSSSPPPVSATVLPVLPPAPSDQIHALILGSDEYYQVNGATPQGFVNALYRDLLGRAPDPGGASYWLGRLASGSSRSDVAYGIASSIEAQRTKIARWFLSDLGWNADLQQIKTIHPIVDWANAPASGAGDASIRARILSSSEFFANNGGTNAGFVAGLYRAVLGREPDPNGASYWLNRLATGASRGDVALAILNATEAKDTTAALWFQNDLRRPTPLAVLKADPGVMNWGNRIIV